MSKKGAKNFQYSFNISPEKLKLYAKLTPEERFKWLEEAHEFISQAVSYEKLKRWKEYLNKKYKF